MQIKPEHEVLGYDTINRFLANPASSFAEEDVSKFSMTCKAVTLFDRAHSLGMSWAAGLRQRPRLCIRPMTDRFYSSPSTLATSAEAKADLATELAAMRHATQAFKDTIAPLAVGANIQDPLITIHMTVLLASIRLDVAPSWAKCSVKSALAAVALVDDASLEHIGPVDPILGFLLTAVGQVFIDELIRIRGLTHKSKEDTEQEVKMKNAMDSLVVVLKECGADCPYICKYYVQFLVVADPRPNASLFFSVSTLEICRADRRSRCTCKRRWFSQPPELVIRQTSPYCINAYKHLPGCDA